MSLDFVESSPLDYSAEVAQATAPIYQKLREFIPELEWPVYAPYVAAINELKKQRNAIILAHNYQTPEIFHGVADLSGDSLALARQAGETTADVILLCGVHFMAETAKLLNPDKSVLIPDLEAGCSCCTSANAVEVVESLGSQQVIFLPDEYLGHYVASKTAVELIVWKGHCEVHERFTADQVRAFRQQHPGVEVLAHPECPPEVLEEADYVGSTSGMINYVGEKRPNYVVMVTECSMSDNVAVEYPDVHFVRPCNLCPHMKRITLPRILASLKNLQHSVEVESEIARRARRAVERMMAVGRGKSG
jgi:quinolinate synthase